MLDYLGYGLALEGLATMDRDSQGGPSAG